MSLGKITSIGKKPTRNAKNVTIATILKVFNALKAKVNFNVELQVRALR